MYIKLYFALDDTEVSEAPAADNAVEFKLKADLDQIGEPIQLYAKAETGYLVDEAIITPTGDNAAKWALAPDVEGEAGEWGEYGESLTLGDGVDDTTGKLFWVKAKATEDEVPHNDLTVTLRASGSAWASE
jgi:hypothetical protein